MAVDSIGDALEGGAGGREVGSIVGSFIRGEENMVESNPRHPIACGPTKRWQSV